MCFCEGKKLSGALIDYFNQQFPGVLTEQKKRILRNAQTLTLSQLYQNLNVWSQIFTNIQAEQFKLEYEYLPKLFLQPLAGIPYQNDYTYQLNYQQELIGNVTKVIVIGKKGSGKSTFINAMANALLIGYADRFRYHIANYDVDGHIQACDLILPDRQLRFLEVPGYTNDETIDQGIMNQLYHYLQERAILIDLILFCRKNTNRGLEDVEKKIIYNLVELFGQNMVTKFQIINTNFDLGQQHSQNLIQSLERISDMHTKMAKPKIMFLNSITTPKEGQAGYLRFETVVQAKNNIIQILETNQVQLRIRGELEYNHRRELEQAMRNTKEQLKQALRILLPHLENYYHLNDINENDSNLTSNQINWNTFNPDLQQHKSYNLGMILENVTLTDAVSTSIMEQAQQRVQNLQLPPDHQRRRLNEIIQFERNKQKFIYMQYKTKQQKEQRVAHIILLAEDYVTIRNEYQQGAFSQGEITVQQLITSEMNDDLQLFLRQKQPFKQELDFESLRNQLFLPNDNLQATQILGGRF